MPLANQGHSNNWNSKGRKTCSAAKSYKRLKKIVSGRRRNKSTQEETTDHTVAPIDEHRNVDGEEPTATPGRSAPLSGIPGVDSPSVHPTSGEALAGSRGGIGVAPLLGAHQGAAHASAQQGVEPAHPGVSLGIFDTQAPAIDHAIPYHQFEVHDGFTSFLLCRHARVNIENSFIIVTLCDCNTHPRLVSQPIVRNVPLPVPNARRASGELSPLGGSPNLNHHITLGANQPNNTTLDSTGGPILPPVDANASPNQSTVPFLHNAPNHDLSAGPSTNEALPSNGAPIPADSPHDDLHDNNTNTVSGHIAPHDNFSSGQMVRRVWDETWKGSLDVEASIDEALEIFEKCTELVGLQLFLPLIHSPLTHTDVWAPRLRSLTITAQVDPGPLFDNLMFSSLTFLRIIGHPDFSFPSDVGSRLHGMLLRSKAELKHLSLIGVFPLESHLIELFQTFGTAIEELTVISGRLSRPPPMLEDRMVSDAVIASLTRSINPLLPRLKALALSPCKCSDGAFAAMVESHANNDLTTVSYGFVDRSSHANDVHRLNRLHSLGRMHITPIL